METTTTLQAVNTILATIGEAPVSSLDGDKTHDVTLAQSTLEEVSREFQSRGWWFNRVSNVTFAVTEDGTIPVTNAVARFKVKKTSLVSPQIVVRDGKLYNISTQSDLFTSNVVASEVIWLLNLSELPETARRYVTIRAAREFERRVLSSQVIAGYTQEAELRAYNEFLREVCEESDLNTNDQPSLINYLRQPLV